jgi:hypothetical protein
VCRFGIYIYIWLDSFSLNTFLSCGRRGIVKKNPYRFTRLGSFSVIIAFWAQLGCRVLAIWKAPKWSRSKALSPVNYSKPLSFSISGSLFSTHTLFAAQGVFQCRGAGFTRPDIVHGEGLLARNPYRFTYPRGLSLLLSELVAGSGGPL